MGEFHYVIPYHIPYTTIVPCRSRFLLARRFSRASRTSSSLLPPPTLTVLTTARLINIKPHATTAYHLTQDVGPIHPFFMYATNPSDHHAIFLYDKRRHTPSGPKFNVSIKRNEKQEFQKARLSGMIQFFAIATRWTDPHDDLPCPLNLPFLIRETSV
jgi:hypothetical protein